MTINEYFKLHEGKRLIPRVVCNDGFNVSIQANEYAYCEPRNNYGPWYMVELGFPSETPSKAIMEYCENEENPTDTVYGYVPVDIVDNFLTEHGGIKIA